MVKRSASEDTMNAAFYPIRQPDGITCGPTCLVILVRALEMLHGNVPKHIPDMMGLLKGYEQQIIETGEEMGTCFKHGTRDIEMAEGLKLYDLPVIRSVGAISPQTPSGERAAYVQKDAWNILHGVLHAGNAVLLRTLWHGAKHWVLMYASEDKEFIVEPASGRRIEVTESWRSFITSAWKMRGYDGFTVCLDSMPSDPFVIPEL